MDERFNDEIFTQEELDSANEKLRNSENITLPEGLSPEAMAQKLDNVDVWVPQPKAEKTKKSMKKKIYGIVAFAATFAIVVTSVMLVKPWQKPNEPPLNGATPPIVNSKPQDYSIIEARFSSYAENYRKSEAKYKLYGIFNEGFLTGATVEDAVADNAASAPQLNGDIQVQTSTTYSDVKGTGEVSFGETNEQVLGVSEADIIKNDGKYIYAVNPENADWESYYDALYGAQGIVKTTNENGEAVKEENTENSNKKPVLDYDCSVSIIEPDSNGKLKRIANVEILQGDNKDVYHMSICEMYVSNNKLTVIVECSVYDDVQDSIFYSGAKRSYAYGGTSNITMAACFDISNKSAPKELWRVYQDGGYISSRLVNDQLVLLSEYWVDISAEEEVVANTCVPEYGVGNSAMTRIPCDCIVIGEQVNNPSYLVASTLDIDDKATLKTQAVLGAGSNVYCTTETLYAASTQYKDSEAAQDIFGSAEEVTEIHKFSIKDYDIKHRGCAQVKGHALNQFSIDEYKGYLRIATTTGHLGESTNQLYVLDDELNVVGKVEGIAKGETIKSVRFTGDTGYVVTFKQTDPLFVIDLADPTNPTVKGELKIPGFSAYLHPVSETLLLGVGVDGTNDGQGNGMKISLFDVSDPEKPIEVDKIEFNGINSQNRWAYVQSPAFYEHKAICWDAKEGIMYIPYSKHDRIWASSNGETLSESYTTGVVAVKVDNNAKALQTDGTYIVNDFENELSRVTFIDNVLLGYSYPEKIVAFNKQTQAVTDKIELG